jgi:pimeloyl-ACP methyl ester carboxylesterase
VRPSARKLAVAFLAAPLALACSLPAPAGAQIAYGPCPHNNDFACGHLTVPLDPSGATPGTITLAVRRRRAPVGEASSAVIALAGGPGQSAVPFAEDFTEVLGPILSTRDLIVFDQRGTGLSHPLACHGFEQPGSYHSAGALLAACAEQIGPERAFYTTPDSVADIEALRRAGGYEKLVLWGTSYGTKVAEQYAQQYPQHVEALVLDSVVPPAGPDPLDRNTFAAVPRILRQLCAYHQCAHVTPSPVGDLARVVQRMHGGTLRGRWVGGHGHPVTVHVSSNELLDVLLAGDFNPILRAEFPAAARAAAAHGDTAPLVRLLARAFGAYGGEREESEGVDEPLFLTTTCEEEAFPWSRAASPSERLAQATAAIDALPASAAAPFTPTNMLDFDELRTCAFWPFATPAPPAVPETMPNVPTLIFSGADDLRTPTANARALAAQIPDAHLLVVPNTGHSALESEPTSCARKALQAMFTGGVGVHSIAPCPVGPPPPLESLAPLAPERLSDVPPAPGNHGRAGRTLQAVALTLADFARQFVLQLLETAGGSGGTLGLSLSSLDSGGLRAGWAQLTKGGLRFHGYSYVPGVTISGTVKAEKVTLRVGGSAAARGTLRLGPHKALVGELAGQRVHLNSGGATASAAIVGADAQASLALGLRGSAVSAAVRRLAGLLSSLPWD